MNKILLIYVVNIIITGFNSSVIAQKYEPKYLRENDQTFKNLTLQTTENGWIEFKKEAKINPNTFFKDYSNSIGLGKDYDFKLIKNEIDLKKNQHQRFKLHYKNIPVEGAEFTLHSSIEGVLTLAHGKIPEDLNVDLSKPISESRALDLALESMKLRLEDYQKNEINKKNGELILTRISEEAIKSNFRLAYVFNIYGTEMLDAFRVHIDANTGEVLKKVSLIRNCFASHHTINNQVSFNKENESIKSTAIAAPLTASTFIPYYTRYLNGQANLNFETEINPNNNAQFRLSAFNSALITRMSNNGSNTSWSTLSDVVNNSTNWQGAEESRIAQTAHWLTQRMYQYLNQTININRNGLNGQGLFPKVVTNWHADLAQWMEDENLLRFGRLNAVSTLVTADVVGHEYFHGVVDYTANLEYEGESGSLDESISDIFGTALERNVLVNPQTVNNPNGWNWLIGEDAQILRNMATPSALGQPEKYLGPNWLPVIPPCTGGSGGNDFCRVHVNNGVLNKWFQTICTGQSINSNIQINAIDFDRATAIVYRALTVYLQSFSNYSDMANATIQSARDLYGNCSIEEETVQNAWSAAQIGGLYFRSCGGTGGVANGCYTIKAKHSNKILQPENGNNGARIRQYDANNSAEQIVEISAADNESYFIQSKATAKAYEIPSTASGDLPVQANNFTFDNRQKWLLVRRTDGSYLMLPKLLQNRAVDVEGVSQNNGAGIMVWGPGIHEGDNQRFFLQTASCEVTPPQSSCTNVGSISYQRWENIGGGTSIQDLRNNTNNLNNSPSHTQTLNSFEAPLNILDNYGVRIRGYVCPPTTGNYTFWVAGDDNSELWISGNDQPTNLSRIAYHTNWTPSLEWGWFSTQQSAPVTLQAGQRYYVEALMKEGGGGDNLAVGWQLPNGSLERPIPGNRLIPFAGGSGGNCNFSVSPSSSNPNPSCGASITLNANCSGSDCGSVNYSWSGNGLSGSNSSVTTNVPSSNGTFTYTITASKSGCNNQSGNVNVTVSGCGGTLNQCIEAESSSGTGAITSDPNASNGETRGEENNYGHYVDYVVANVPSAGTYYVKLRYYSSSAPAIGVQVNGSGGGNFSLPHSGSWNIVWTEYTFTVSLGAGTNTIRIQGTGGGSCRQDCICVSSNPPRIGVAGEKEAVSEESQTLQLYPNPTDGKVMVRYKLEKGQKASLQFINAKGQVLIQKGLVGEGGWGQSQADLSAQPEGSYVVRMETQEKTVSRKFMIAK